MTKRIQLITLFVTVATILMASAFLSYYSGLAVLHIYQRIANGENAVKKLEDVFVSVQSAEAGQRGYLITGEEPYLAPYKSAIEKIHAQLTDLRSINVGSDEVDHIQKLVDQKLTELARTVALRRAGHSDDAILEVKTSIGRNLMDEIRDRVTEINDRSLDTLQQDRKHAGSLMNVRSGVFVLVVLINLATLFWAYRRIDHGIENQRAAATEMQQQKELLSVTLSSIGDAVIITDIESRITFVNRVAESLTGWKFSESIGLPLAKIFNIINESTRVLVESPAEKVLRLGTIVGLANHTLLIRKDGSEVPIDDSGAPIREPNGAIRGVVLVFRDFSEHKAAEKQILEAKLKIEAASRAKDQFLAMLSHELRTPLSPALLTATMMASDASLPGPIRDDASMIQRNIELEARLIDDLLDVSRIIAGKMSLHLDPISIHQVLRDCISMCASEADRKGLPVAVEFNADKDSVDGDIGKLHQVFCNLLKNAIKFTPSSGRVTVRTSENHSGGLRIEIVDTGIGISSDVLPHLFDPFEQGGRAVTQTYGGLGLGLAVSKGIIDAHGGTIFASSRGKDLGTTLSVELPESVNKEIQPSPASPATTPDSPGVPLSILLVEDHEDTLRAMKLLLSKLKHRVTTANTVASALEAANTADFDLLISDVGLPDGTGLDLIRGLLARRPIRGIAITGYGMESDVAHALEAGFARHITKPVNFLHLQQVIQELSKAE